MQIFLLSARLDGDGDIRWAELEKAGYQVLFSTEEEGRQEYTIQSTENQEKVLKKFPWVQSVEPTVLPEMDYEKEWERHAPFLIDGKIHLKVLQKTILLEAGEGFGDFSHPTTRLVFELMQPFVVEKTVIDIGSGSGVLSLAAIGFGAKKAIGVEIDPRAIAHAKANAALNQMERRAEFLTPLEFSRLELTGECSVVMNMILLEQKTAWEALIKKQLSGIVVSSGILEDQLEDYKKFAKENGWSIIKVEKQEGWLGIVAEF